MKFGRQRCFNPIAHSPHNTVWGVLMPAMDVQLFTLFHLPNLWLFQLFFFSSRWQIKHNICLSIYDWVHRLHIDSMYVPLSESNRIWAGFQWHMMMPPEYIEFGVVFLCVCVCSVTLPFAFYFIKLFDLHCEMSSTHRVCMHLWWWRIFELYTHAYILFNHRWLFCIAVGIDATKKTNICFLLENSLLTDYACFFFIIIIIIQYSMYVYENNRNSR